jgi:hypothetical protein
MIQWLKALLSQSRQASSSRVLQAFIAISVTIMLFIVLAHNQWYIHDNTRLVLLTLIGAGATGYVSSKLMEGKGE